MKRNCLWLILIMFVLGGCADSSTKGNIEEHDTAQTITINNNGDNTSAFVYFPVEYASKETSAVDQTTEGTSNINPDTVLNLADKAAQIASGAAQLKDALTNLDESNRPQDSYNPVTTTTPPATTPTVTPVTPVPTPTPAPTEPAEPADPDMHGFTHKKTIENTGDKMSYRSGDEESVDQDKFVFANTLGDDYGTGGGLLVFSDGNELKIPDTTKMAMLPESGGYRKWQPGGKYSNNNSSIPWAEAYASRYTHPASVTLYYNGIGAIDGEDDVPAVDPPSGTLPSLSDIKWLHTDVSGWPETAKLSAVSTTSSTITLPFDKTSSWPAMDISSDPNEKTMVNANPWIFLKHDDGKWYAATWEWMRPGKTSKSKTAVAGDHIKKSPLQNFKPVVGETYYFMVSGLARDSKRTVQERSNIVPFVWK